MRKEKAFHNSVQVQHVYESYFLLEKNPTLSEVQRYVFDSLLGTSGHVTLSVDLIGKHRISCFNEEILCNKNWNHF